MHRITCRLAVAVAAAGLFVATGCAKEEAVSTAPTSTPVTASSGGSTSTTDGEEPDPDGDNYAEACSIIEEIDDLQADGDLEQGLALFADVRDAGPEELADHWDTLSDVYGQMVELEGSGEQEGDLEAMFELLEDPDFLEAARAIDDFAEEECELDIDLDPAEESDAPGGRTGGDDLPNDTVDPGDDPTSIDALQTHLEDTYGTEAWWPVLDDASGWSSSSFGKGVEWSVTLSSSSSAPSLTASELEAACDAIADYLDTYEDGDVMVAITDADEVVLVSRDPGEACTAA